MKDERAALKTIIEKHILNWFLHKYSHLDQVDIRGTMEREIRADAENCADRLVDDILKRNVSKCPTCEGVQFVKVVTSAYARWQLYEECPDCSGRNPL